jgi:hypothetical protein
MNYNPNWNNPQQQWNQPPAPKPQPKKSMKWPVIITLIVVGVVGGAISLAVFLGKSMAGLVERSSRHSMELRKSLIAPAPASTQDYYSIIDEINSDSLLADSTKVKLTQHLNELRKKANEINELVELYEDGYNDTLPRTRRHDSEQEIAHAYFIQSGRATNLKQALTELQEETLKNLPDTSQASRFVNILDVYDNDTAPDYLRQSTSWESTRFDQSSFAVRMHLDMIKQQVESFERAILKYYSEDL